MKRVLAALLLTSTIAFAQAPRIKDGSAVYIEPMSGYGTTFAAAMMKRHVPLVVVTDKKRADYIISCAARHKDLVQPAKGAAVSNTTVVNVNTSPETSGELYRERAAQLQDQAWAEKRALGETDVTITMVDPRSSRVVFACSSAETGNKQIQKTADICAKRLKDVIEKPKR
ncbi:MAG: hypothetical protein WCA44_11925 [Acidobacteriaceae bacterium]